MLIATFRSTMLSIAAFKATMLSVGEFNYIIFIARVIQIQTNGKVQYS
jgi:hypothetical protein